MDQTSRVRPTDLLGLSGLAIDGTVSMTELIEAMHDAIMGGPGISGTPAAALGGRENQDFLVLFYQTKGVLSNGEAGQNTDHPTDMWGNMWGCRTLIFWTTRNLLIRLVAGEGFEPSTFGL